MRFYFKGETLKLMSLSVTTKSIATSNKLSRVEIMVTSFQRHRFDTSSRLIRDIVTRVPQYTPLTEKSVEAMLLQVKGPYSLTGVKKLLDFLKDNVHYPLNKKEKSEEAAALKGLVAVDLAKYHPETARLKETILEIIDEMIAGSYFTSDKSSLSSGKPSIYFERFVAALWLINKPGAQRIMRRQNIPESTINHLANEVK